MHAACKWLFGHYHAPPIQKPIGLKQVLKKLQLEIHDFFERPCI
jgi:hypothetical protein